MNRRSIRMTATELEDVLHRLDVTFSRTDSQTSRSIYFKLFHKNGTVSLKIRISDHEYADTNTANIICIGNHKGAVYSLDEWYKAVSDIKSIVHCVEVKSLSAKIICEIEVKERQQNKNFQNTLQNVRNKILRFTCTTDVQTSTEKEQMDILAGLFTGFATRFNLSIQKTMLPSGYLFRLQHQNCLPVYIATSRYRPDSLPEDCRREHLVLVGKYMTANFRYKDWKKILRVTLERIGLIGKTHKRTLEQFIEKKATRGFTL